MSAVGWPAALALLSLASCATPAADLDDATIVIRFADDTGGGEVTEGAVTISALPATVARGLAEASPSTTSWRACFAVHTVRDDGTLGQPPVVGRYDVVVDEVEFAPRFPPSPGMTYRARADVACLARLADRTQEASEPIWRDATWISPAPSVEAPRVIAVYPSSAVVPANLLKLYIHFSAPMARGDAYEHIRLIDVETSTAVEAPFLALGEELWDDAQQRFTLFFDPGRIKRGLRPHHEAGPPLEEGRRYRLEIASTWTSAAGPALDEGYVKSFLVSSDDRVAPSVDDWAITVPVADSVAPVEIAFPEPLDHALLHRVVRVRHADGESVAGRVTVSGDEIFWRWVPEAPWAAGPYRLEIEAILEDLAGNNLNGVFDREVGAQRAPSQVPTVELPFVVETTSSRDGVSLSQPLTD